MRDTLRRSALAACSCFLDTSYQYQATSTGAEEMLSISLVLQKGSRANLQPSKAAPSSRNVSREVAGALDEVINAIEMPSQSERPEQCDPAQFDAVDQAAGAKAPGSSKPEVHLTLIYSACYCACTWPNSGAVYHSLKAHCARLGKWPHSLQPDVGLDTHHCSARNSTGSPIRICMCAGRWCHSQRGPRH